MEKFLMKLVELLEEHRGDIVSKDVEGINIDLGFSNPGKPDYKIEWTTRHTIESCD